MMRLIVPAALEVCSVPNTMWPVSAAVMAASIVSRSRISPTRITSGSCRKARRIASENDVHVDADLALVDRRLLVLVVELDRVFDRDDVVVDVVVDVVDHRGQRRGLARAGRPGDEQQPARPHDQALEDLRQAELLHRQHLDRESAAAPSRRCRAAGRPRRGTGHASPNAKPKSRAARFLQFLLAAVGRDALHQRQRVGRLEHLGLELAASGRAAAAPAAGRR